jgi:ComF family protein
MSAPAAGIVARGLARLAAPLAAWALPQRCPACGDGAAAASLLCARCRAAIPAAAVTLCARCLVREREPAGCLRHPGFAVRAAWIYDARAAAVVAALKFEGRAGLARGLGALLAHTAVSLGPADGIVAVPLHRARERERGYNQAARLAAALAEHAGVPWLPGVLARTRPTPAQSRLGPVERRANVAGAFRVVQPWAVRARRVWIVDDVVTTGATLDACLDALRDAGATASAITLAWAA